MRKKFVVIVCGLLLLFVVFTTLMEKDEFPAVNQ
jgi:hypothetical protein